ncbi:nicotinate (nicotinamide) nucleotide adenylyltransferase [Phorcysia thermohydrogeniphila]|uniref:Probable nicotinate-nucleotide adenylyltransferase n=1 Tax=Phorcysia thermohydrogeniphila TaxID=936138 RepID=A0A4R1G7G5_9BACT|nr:nicotinate (nicotinamide) nucleotide adenylyltransferase [Phorcysia thermohydrogeniphila]TCK04017.1 nicotinate-nucleotide adenylyltransferase [Phorcysia thermohydrogeniphila]
MKALFGGSFNPVHFGHLILARDVLETLNLEKVIFVPAYLQPLKGELLIPPEVRLALLKASIKGEEGFEVWDYEIREGGISYTVETLREFHRIHGEKPLFMMGADSFNSFHLWKEPKEILKLAKILILLRPGYQLKLDEVFSKLGVTLRHVTVERGKKFLLSDGVDLLIFKGRAVEISSTEIRNRLKSGKPISFFLPEEAEKILRRWWKDVFQ